MLVAVLGSALFATGSPVRAAGTWRDTGGMTVGRAGASVTLLRDGLVLVTGGESYDQVMLATAELYDPATETWRETVGMSTPRAGHSATLLPNGLVLVAGGEHALGDHYIRTATAELYDPETETWRATGSMGQARVGHYAMLLPSGQVLVAGGETDSSESEVDTRPTTSELYDPTTETWTNGGDIAPNRVHSSMVLLPTGQVLVFGGWCCVDAYLAEAASFDPATGVRSETNHMQTGRSGASATVLPSGQVLVAGGAFHNGYLASAELYDPATGTWSATGKMTVARAGHTATLLANGQVLVTGGEKSPFSDAPQLASAEVYDPATGSWTATSSMNTPRSGHNALLLPSGQVLVAGGDGPPIKTGSDHVFFITSGPALSSAELYNP